ncbi:MAG: hypothetical protein JO257_13020 [Deltaproteobacteria bacterium]|nr:hypothetical protein [Deltaproteobacteria bacterium]
MSANQNEERLAAIAFILDRVEQFAPSSSNRAFASELVAGLAEGRHIECARAGEYEDLNWRVLRIIKAYEAVTPLVRRPKLSVVR